MKAWEPTETSACTSKGEARNNKYNRKRQSLALQPPHHIRKTGKTKPEGHGSEKTITTSTELGEGNETKRASLKTLPYLLQYTHRYFAEQAKIVLPRFNSEPHRHWLQALRVNLQTGLSRNEQKKHHTPYTMPT